jgi:hypothetical protein
MKMEENVVRSEEMPTGPELAVFLNKIVAFNLGSRQWSTMSFLSTLQKAR